MRSDLKDEVIKRKDNYIKQTLQNINDSSALWRIFDFMGLTSTTNTSPLKFLIATKINIFFSRINISLHTCLALPQFSPLATANTSFSLTEVTLE